MLKQTERELAQLKRQKATKIQQNKVRNNNSKPTRGGRGGRGGGRGAGRGGGRGGAARGQKPKSADALDAELDGYMLGTKGGLDQELDAYMSSTKVQIYRKKIIFKKIFRMVLTSKWKSTWPPRTPHKPRALKSVLNCLKIPI